MAIPILSGILGIVNTVGGLVSNWQERKKIESQGKVDVAKAKVEGEVKRAQTELDGDIQYDIAAQEGMQHSWKDEWLTILLSLPFIMCFIPPLTDYVKAGFEVLKTSTPDWYQWAFLAIITASFGLRGFMKSKGGPKL